MQKLIDFVKYVLRVFLTLLAEIGFISDEQLSKWYA